MGIQSQRFPNLYLIGAPKAGTTTLFSIFETSADIFTPHAKEPSFFRFAGETTVDHRGTLVPTFGFQHDEQTYLDLYRSWQSERYAIDASTNYLSYPGIAQKINRHSPDAKAIAILRPPLQRAYSHYLMEVRDGWVEESFHAALKLEQSEMDRGEGVVPSTAGHYSFLRQSLYLDGVKDFFATFGKDRFRVYAFEDIVSDEGAAIRDIGRFLGLSSLERPPKVQVQNAFAVDRFPTLTKLINIYRYSRLRPIINFLTPRAARDIVRTKMYDIRRKKSQKPSMSDEAAALLKAGLKNDFEDTVAFARSNGIYGS